jgi:hypothetical protein
MWNVWGKDEVHREFRWGNLKGRDHLKHFSVGGRIILKLIFKN